ncbi:MAG: DUF1905 domain-containing protein [SAR202 cluster bacterium]|nr:DUF1905 domain-containing protein [SAR202 cluster bacterium]
MRAKVWLYAGPSGWHFVTLPKEQSSEIKARFNLVKRGWGSLPVAVTIGKTTWDTSIFPDRESGAYLLPLKADVRAREGIKVGDVITFAVKIKA